jgi:hypothetical protein
MKRWFMPLMVVMTILLSSTSGCLGLIQSREFLEEIRDDKIERNILSEFDHAHTFDTFTEIQPYSNSTSIPIDETAYEVTIYVKATFINIPDNPIFNATCFEDITRYIRAELFDSNGVSVWSLDECENVPARSETFEPEPTFTPGSWELVIEARGAGVPTTAIQDKFVINVDVKRVCVVYPLETECD